MMNDFKTICSKHGYNFTVGNNHYLFDLFSYNIPEIEERIDLLKSFISGRNAEFFDWSSYGVNWGTACFRASFIFIFPSTVSNYYLQDKDGNLITDNINGNPLIDTDKIEAKTKDFLKIPYVKLIPLLQEWVDIMLKDVRGNI